MDNNQIIKELEAAAQILLAPPNLISSEQLHSAESVFLEFRKTKTPYLLCKQILETNTVDYVLFESVGLIKIALIREWNLISKEDVNSVKEYLLHYVVNKPIAPFVRESIFQVIAIIVKKLDTDDSEENVTTILNQVESMIMNGDLQRKLRGCGIISALIHEFTISTKSSNIGLMLTQHVAIQRKFEKTGLKRIFKFCITALSELTKDTVPEIFLSFIRYLLSIVEEILTSDHFCLFSFTFILNQSRGDVLDLSIIQLFFTMYSTVRTNLRLAHYGRSCLVPLSNLCENAMSTEEIKLQYLCNYMQEFLKLFSNIDIIDQEALSIANIIHNLITQFLPKFNSIEPNLSNSFMEQVIRLTRIFAEGAAQEESVCSNDYLYIEAFEQILKTWTTILCQNNKLFSVECYQQLCIQIFDIYLKSKLSPPNGFRALSREVLEAEITEIEEDDRSKFESQLQLVGDIGRKILNHSLISLVRLLEEQTNKLRHELNYCTADLSEYFQSLQLEMQSQSFTISTNERPGNLENIYEDLHWLILISSHVLSIISSTTMKNSEELLLIPSEILQYNTTRLKEGKTDMNVTLQLLGSPQCNLSDIPGAEESADHMIRVIAAVLRLCEIQRKMIDANITHILSPELIRSILWFLTSWSVSYLLPDEKNYTEISLTIVQAFGVDSEGAQWSVNFLLDYARCILNAFKGEEEVANDVIELLLALVKSKEKASCVLKSDRMGYFIELTTKNKFSLPQSAKRGLISAVIQTGIALKNKLDHKQFLAQTIQHFQEKFAQIISKDDFSRTYHEEYMKVQISELLESFIGIVKGLGLSMPEYAFQIFYPVFTELDNLLSYYHNYSEIVKLIFELLCVYSKEVQGNNKEENLKMHKIYANNIQVYARCNINRLTTNATEEENPYEGLLLIMQLLINISLDSFFIDETNIRNSVTDISVYGLNCIIPMITIEILKFPSLCNTYYKLLNDVNSFAIFKLQPEILKQLMASLEFGLYSFGENITELCCNVIKKLAECILKEILKENKRNLILAPFMNVLINLCQWEQIRLAQIDASRTIFYLIYCYHDEYQRIMENYIASQSDPEIQQQLASAFTELIANFKFNDRFTSFKRSEQQEFEKKFEKFVITLRDILIIK